MDEHKNSLGLSNRIQVRSSINFTPSTLDKADPVGRREADPPTTLSKVLTSIETSKPCKNNNFLSGPDTAR